MRPLPRPRTVLLAALLAAAGGHAADAQSVTPQGAAEIASAIEDGIRRMLPADPELGALYEMDGEVQAIPSGDRYRVRVPRITFHDGEGASAVLDTVEIDLKPLDGGRYEVDARLPSTIPFTEAEGTPSGELRIGSHRIGGVWMPAIENFVMLDARVENIRAVLPDGTQPVELAAFAFTTDLREDAPGSWSGPAAVELLGLRGADEFGNEVLDLGRLRVDARYEGFDLERYADWNERIQAMALDPEAASEDLPTVFREFLAPLADMFDGVSVEFAVEALRVLDPETGEGVAIERLHLTESLDGLRQDFSTFRLGYGHSGLAIDGVPEDMAAFVPERIELGLAVAHLPNAALGEAIGQYVANLEATDEETADAILGEQVLAALSQAGTELRLDALEYASPLLGAQAAGVLLLDPSAAMQAVATLDAAVRGLDEAMQAFAPAQGETPDEETQGLLMVLGMLNALGQQGQDAEGRPVRTYRIELAADGRILLNGADMGPILQGIPGEDEE